MLDFHSSLQIDPTLVHNWFCGFCPLLSLRLLHAPQDHLGDELSSQEDLITPVFLDIGLVQLKLHQSQDEGPAPDLEVTNPLGVAAW